MDVSSFVSIFVKQTRKYIISMEITIKSKDVHIYTGSSVNTVFKVMSSNSGRFIKQVKHKDEFLYYLCSSTGIDENDSILFSEGEYIGKSKGDILTDDVLLRI